METNSKAKIRDFAKDLNVTPNDAIEIVANYLGVEKKVGASFIGEELDVVLDKLTQDNQVDSFDEYLAEGERAREERARAAQRAREEEEKRAEEEARREEAKKAEVARKAEEAR